MKHYSLKIAALLLVGAGLFGCLKVEDYKNDNTAYVGDWQLTRLMGLDAVPIDSFTSKIDTIFNELIPENVDRMNLLLDGTGTITRTDHVVNDDIKYEALTMPVNYEWVSSGLYTYLYVAFKQNNQTMYYGYAVNRVTADSLVLTNSGSYTDDKGVVHVRGYRSFYTK
ncbi:MAG: hypothetical protein SOZ00_00230 [Tidjanibacter sp.]|nr:hypothetical protein [Tidjanibacter sp.]